MEGDEGGAVEGGEFSAWLLGGLFLLGSSVLFYKFAWLFYREKLFPYESFAATTATLQANAGGGGSLSLKGAGRAFSATFALSSCIFELVVLEMTGLLNPASSALAWQACLGAMVIGLHVGLPCLLVYAYLGDMGFGRRASCVGAVTLLVGFFVIASNLGGRDGIDTPLGDAVDGSEEAFGKGGVGVHQGHWSSVFSLEAGLARVGVVGVASLALLSGFGAVNLPYQQLATLLRRVPPSLIQSRELRARITLADIGQRKRRAAIARAASTARSEGVGGLTGAGDGVSYGKRSSLGRGLIARIMRVVTAPASTASKPSHQAAEAETASLERIAQELFLEIADCRRIQEQQRRARRPTGWILVVFGAVMFVYCLLRLWKAAVTVLWVPYIYGGGGSSAGVSGGEGTGDDPATRLVRFALSRHLLVDADAEGWNELISFVLIGILVLLQTRGFLAMIATVSRALSISGLTVPLEVLSVLASILMGTCFTSSVILMRVNIPRRHRVAVKTVLGGMRFSFYQRWFDTVFLLSGCVTAVTLLALHFANRTSDADHHDDRHAKKRLDAEGYARQGGGVSTPGGGTSGTGSGIRPRGGQVEWKKQS